MNSRIDLCSVRPISFGGGGGGGETCTSDPATWGGSFDSEGNWAGVGPTQSGSLNSYVTCTLTATEKTNHSTDFKVSCTYAVPGGRFETVTKTLNSAEFASCLALQQGVRVTVGTLATPLAGFVAGQAANWACSRAFDQANNAIP